MTLPIETLSKIREQLKQGDSRLKELTGDINEARNAGLDVTEFVKEADNLKRQLSQLKAVYGGK